MSSKTMTTGRKEEVPARLVPRLRFPEFRKAAEWAVKPFDDLFIVGNGRDYKHLEAGDVPVYGSGGYMLSVNDHLCDGESVCIGRKGTIDKPMFLTGRFWAVDTLFYTHSFKECLPRFIFAIFQQIDWLKHNEAGGVPSLSKTNIQKIPTAVPSLPEQQKIAECLSSVDELMAAQARKVDALKTHKKGLMQQLFPREGETQPRLRFPEFRNAGEWEPLTLGSVCSSFSGGTPSTTKPEYYEGDIPFIRSAEIARDRTELFLTREGLANSASKIVAKGDVLVALYGANSGDVAIAKISGAINQAILCLKSKVSNAFIYQFLSFKKDWVVATYLQGGQGNLSGEIVKSISVCFPLPAEQQRIASCLSSLDELIIAETHKLEALKTHKQGLMQQLFPSPAEADA
ncbi:restriction endonuclease subunit S [Cyanobium sp. Morenito 9A2]|uniref:restriction endonuclease subunit S n=1 Tax=Cyanobium sp. Morenito 9A2 TaxID=2823718 RepID=UPI0020CDB976|nr:restriction endonuclease subunit S [Cyanobium sp. Morenito 9A2]MCP9848514.1 restriction endonuclease subunit S [Cyanobium sp. Morenito 9A2]